MKKLVVIRGNSGSGKTTLAKELREKLKELGHSKKIAVIGQDAIRRKMLDENGDGKELDNVNLIKINIQYCLDRDYLTIVEGIFYRESYIEIFQELIEYVDSHLFYYLDIPFEETLKRHCTKCKDLQQAFGEPEMKRWYREQDYLNIGGEIVISKDSSLEESLSLILEDIS
jgi:predicted kinase